VSGMMRDVRERNGDDRDVVDTHDGADIDIQADLDLALIQMKAETLGRIDAALRRLAAGAYGNCIKCARAIRTFSMVCG
jgi:RNA polymerase-binding transcription factor DksA